MNSDKAAATLAIAPPRSLAGNCWLTLGLLTAIHVVSTIDRTIPQIIAEQVKHEFALSDGQVGIFLGAAFGLPYGIGALLLGPAVDRFSRRKLLAIVVSIWSAMTLLTGLASSYLMLLMARGGVGAAESGSMPTGTSLICDIFPPHRRSTAIGLYNTSVALGIFLSGVLVANIQTSYGWRATFLVAGIPGFILVLLLLLFVRDPVRGGMDQGEAADATHATYRRALRFLLANRKVTPTFVSIMLISLINAAISTFSVMFLQREHDLSAKEASYYFALMAGLGAFGPILLGVIADRIIRGGLARGYIFFAVVASVMAVAAITIAVAPSLAIVIGMLGLWSLLNFGIFPPIFAVLLTITAAGMRGTVMAMVLVGSVTIGLGGGPVVLGVMSDLIGGPQSIGRAMVLMAFLCYLPAVAMFVFTARTLKTGQ